MIVFIQHKATGLYWSKEQTWISQREEALHFNRTIAAVDFCRQRKLEEVELVLLFAGSETAVRVAALVKRVMKQDTLMSLLGAGIVFSHAEQWFHGLRWLGTVGSLKMSNLDWFCGVVSNSG